MRKEYFMKKKIIFFIGLIVLILIIIFGFNGCKEAEEDSFEDSLEYSFEYIFFNKSSYIIIVEIGSEYDFNPMRATINIGGHRIFYTNRFYPYGFSFTWYRQDTGGSWGVRWDEASSSFVNN